MQDTLYERPDLEKKDIPVVFWDDFNLSNPPNWHKNVEILYCISGKGVLSCNGIERDMIPGHIYCINNGEVHSMVNRAVLHYYCFIVDCNFLAQNKLVFEDLRLETEVYSETVSELFKEIVKDIRQPSRFGPARIRGNLISLMALLYQNHSIPCVKQNALSIQDINSAVKAAVKYIDSNFHQKLTLEDIAKSSGFSKFHFARQFKQVTGMTVVSYINLIRCQHAKSLIAKGRLSIQQVAERCGYDNASYFSRVFYKNVGLLPTEYLKQHMNDYLN